MVRPQRRRLGPLEALVLEGAPGAPAIVLFHGYGADAADLAPLAPALAVPGRPTWVFPEGPISLGLAGWSGARAWFPIDEEALGQAQISGRPIDLSKGGTAEAPNVLKTGALAREALEALAVPWERLILGGFSQGAMLAVDLALRGPKAPLGLAILSGALVGAAGWEALAAGRAGLRFFQSHGTDDPLLSFENAKRLEALLLAGGLRGEFLNFEGGHGIPPEAAEGLARFLSSFKS